MRILVPIDITEPKTRLAGLLSYPERRAFIQAMLRDVLTAINAAGDHDPLVLSTKPIDVQAEVEVDSLPLSAAVNTRLSEELLPTAVVMSDLPLITPQVIRHLVNQPNDVTISPGTGGGTNAVVVRTEQFFVDYHGLSYCDHQKIARDAGLTVSKFDSYRLSVDIDEPADLIEVLIHNTGDAREWLHNAGFALECTDVQRGRMVVSRHGQSVR